MAKKDKAAAAATTEGAATTTETPPAVEKPTQPKQNGISRPKDGTATGRVWAIFDKLSQEQGKPASRGDVMTAGKAENLNEATIATQYGRARKFYGLKTEKKATATPAAPTAEVEKDDAE